jgi:hypothetical protein
MAGLKIAAEHVSPIHADTPAAGCDQTERYASPRPDGYISPKLRQSWAERNP